MPTAMQRLLHCLPIDARPIDEAECVLSVLLAILFAHLLGAANVSWAAFSGYIVMRGHAADTLTRGILRVVGTLGGGLLALVATPLVVASPLLRVAAVAAVCTASLYGALTARRAYAWLFFGLTFVMILLDAAEHPNLPLAAFVRTRIVEVGAGTVACVLVSLASILSLRRLWPAQRIAVGRGLGWHPAAMRHAAQAGIALAILVLLGALFAIPALSAGAITIMAVMMVPAGSIGGGALTPVTQRLLHRFVGCAGGALLAAATLLIAGTSSAVPLLVTAAGVALGRHLENGGSRFAYAGTQFVLALLIILVPDDFATAQLGPGLDRLAGVVIGMAVLEPVLLAWHWFAPRTPAAVGAESEPGGV